MKARLKRHRRQRNVSIEGWVELERLRPAREVPKPEKAPFGTPLFGNRQLVACDLEGGAFPAICRLHLNQSLLPVW